MKTLKQLVEEGILVESEDEFGLKEYKFKDVDTVFSFYPDTMFNDDNLVISEEPICVDKVGAKAYKFAGRYSTRECRHYASKYGKNGYDYNPCYYRVKNKDGSESIVYGYDMQKAAKKDYGRNIYADKYIYVCC